MQRKERQTIPEISGETNEVQIERRLLRLGKYSRKLWHSGAKWGNSSRPLSVVFPIQNPEVVSCANIWKVNQMRIDLLKSDEMVPFNNSNSVILSSLSTNCATNLTARLTFSSSSRLPFKIVLCVWSRFFHIRRRTQFDNLSRMSELLWCTHTLVHTA